MRVRIQFHTLKINQKFSSNTPVEGAMLNKFFILAFSPKENSTIEIIFKTTALCFLLILAADCSENMYHCTLLSFQKITNLRRTGYCEKQICRSKHKGTNRKASQYREVGGRILELLIGYLQSI